MRRMLPYLLCSRDWLKALSINALRLGLLACQRLGEHCNSLAAYAPPEMCGASKRGGAFSWGKLKVADFNTVLVVLLLPVSPSRRSARFSALACRFVWDLSFLLTSFSSTIAAVRLLLKHGRQERAM